MKNKYVFCSIFAGLFLIVTSCNNLYDSEISQNKQNTQSLVGKTVVSLSVNLSQARTIMPTDVTAEDITKVELFQDGKKLDSWNGLTALSDASVTIDYGTYDFTIKLYTTEGQNEETEEDVYRLVQTGSLREFTVDENTTSLAFTTSYVDKGSLSVTVQWSAEEDGTSRIDRVDAALYEVGTGGAIGEEVSNVTLETSEPSKKETKYSVVTTASNVPNGSYYIVFTLYDSIYSGKDVVLNTVREIVKINGFKTSGTITLNKLNEVSTSDGDLAFENGALEISISDAKLYLNTNVAFGAKNASNQDVTSNTEWSAQLLYKGTDVNELAADSTVPYYTVVGDSLSINGKNNPLPEGSYQLYVTVTCENVTSSQTFDITAVQQYETPETQIALYTYGYDNSVSAYKTSYYLTNDSDVSEVTVGGTADLTAVTSTNSAFDAFGNFYALTKADSKAQVIVYSRASGTSTTIELAELSSYDAAMRGFTIDIANNTAYGYQKNESSLTLFKYPSLITDGTVSDVVSYSTSLSLSETKKLAICNNKLYVLGYDSSAWNILVYDISSGLSINSSVLYSCVLDSILPESLSYAKFDSSNYNGYYGDMYANDDVVYILVKPFTKWTSDNPNIYGGAVLKWVPGESSVSVLGLAEKAISQETITQMYLYKTDGYESPVYADENGATVKTMLADSTSYTAGTDNATYARTDGYKFFPNVYAVSSVEDDSAFAGPARIIGLKPKKLVIADDGYAFYTDSLGALCVKNANRVVTIDLEEFVIESINTTAATFDSELTSFLLSSVSIDTVRSGGTYYDYNASAWYFDSSERSYKTYSIGWGNSVYLSVKNEE